MPPLCLRERFARKDDEMSKRFQVWRGFLADVGLDTVVPADNAAHAAKQWVDEHIRLEDADTIITLRQVDDGDGPYLAKTFRVGKTVTSVVTPAVTSLEIEAPPVAAPPVGQALPFMERFNRSESERDYFPTLLAHVAKGREKYPEGCTALSLADECGEFVHALNKRESVQRVREELLDVAGVAMRLYLGEVDEESILKGLLQLGSRCCDCRKPVPHGYGQCARCADAAGP